MSTTISKLLEIRKVTEIARNDDRIEMQSTHEQLRGKHIETLEHLQVLTDDNESLRRDLLSLKMKFGLIQDDRAEDFEADSTSNNDDDAILTNVHDASSTIRTTYEQQSYDEFER